MLNKTRQHANDEPWVQFTYKFLEDQQEKMHIHWFFSSRTVDAECGIWVHWVAGTNPPVEKGEGEGRLMIKDLSLTLWWRKIMSHFFSAAFIWNTFIVSLLLHISHSNTKSILNRIYCLLTHTAQASITLPYSVFTLAFFIKHKSVKCLISSCCSKFCFTFLFLTFLSQS